MTYPEVPHPPQGSPRTMRTAHCAEHAYNTTNLETFTYSDGQCVQSVVCVCDLGYVKESGWNERQCIGNSALSNHNILFTKLYIFVVQLVKLVSIGA